MVYTKDLRPLEIGLNAALRCEDVSYSSEPFLRNRYFAFLPFFSDKFFSSVSHRSDRKRKDDVIPSLPPNPIMVFFLLLYYVVRGCKSKVKRRRRRRRRRKKIPQKGGRIRGRRTVCCSITHV